jgi:hypothetical protein
MQIQFFHQVRPVLLHRVEADAEEIGDFLTGISFPDRHGWHPSGYTLRPPRAKRPALPDIIEFIGVIQGKIGRPTFIGLQQVHFHFGNEFPFVNEFRSFLSFHLFLLLDPDFQRPGPSGDRIRPVATIPEAPV